jgi:hypothetical protein
MEWPAATSRVKETARRGSQEHFSVLVAEMARLKEAREILCMWPDWWSPRFGDDCFAIDH